MPWWHRNRSTPATNGSDDLLWELRVGNVTPLPTELINDPFDLQTASGAFENRADGVALGGGCTSHLTGYGDYYDRFGKDPAAIARLKEASQATSNPTLQFHRIVQEQVESAVAALDSLQSILATSQEASATRQLSPLVARRAAAAHAALDRLQFELSEDAKYRGTYQELGLKVQPYVMSGGQPLLVNGSKIRVDVADG